MRRKEILFFAVIAVLFFQAAAGVASPRFRYDPGTQTRRELSQPQTFAGQRLFRETCKKCHSRDNGQGAPFLYAEKLTMQAWNRVFYSRYPACAQKGSWETIAAADILKINDYLFRNGADAYNPNDAEDCG